MGRSFTPTYRIETRESNVASTPAAWDSKRHGRPTDERLADYVESLEASYQPGGVNDHVARVLGIDPPRILSARIVRQSTGEIVAAWTRPLFTVDAERDVEVA